MNALSLGSMSTNSGGVVSNKILFNTILSPLFPARSVPDITIWYVTPSKSFGGSEKIKSNFSPSFF